MEEGIIKYEEDINGRIEKNNLLILITYNTINIFVEDKDLKLNKFAIKKPFPLNGVKNCLQHGVIVITRVYSIKYFAVHDDEVLLVRLYKFGNIDYDEILGFNKVVKVTIDELCQLVENLGYLLMKKQNHKVEDIKPVRILDGKHEIGRPKKITFNLANWWREINNGRARMA